MKKDLHGLKIDTPAVGEASPLVRKAKRPFDTIQQKS